jgi:hypothetical protein
VEASARLKVSPAAQLPTAALEEVAAVPSEQLRLTSTAAGESIVPPGGLTADIKTASVERILYSSSNVSSVNKDAVIPKTTTNVTSNNVTAATASTAAAAVYPLHGMLSGRAEQEWQRKVELRREQDLT